MGQSRSHRDSIENPFVNGGEVRLRLGSGDYTIRAGASDRIRVEWISKKPLRGEEIGNAVRINRTGTSATIRTDGPLKNSRFVIELPPRSDLRLNLRAGDVKITGIEGNKDVNMTAGDLDIDIGPGSYSRIEASTTFGDLNAPALRISKGGIGRSFAWSGDGQYELRAHLFAGDVKFSK